MKKIYRAGLIPLKYDYDNPEQSKMMFMVPSDSKYGGTDPQIAKGQIEEGESAREAAIREAQEELGLRLTNIIEVFDCGTWLGRTDVFVALIKSDDPSDFDQPHFETESVHWLTLEQFNQKGRDIHVDVVNKAFDLVSMTLDCM